MDCSRKTIDRAVHRLREEGMIEVGVCRLETGGISANVYRLAWDPAKTRLEQSGPNEKDE